MTESTRGYAVLLVCFLTVLILWSAACPRVRTETRGRGDRGDRGNRGGTTVGYRIDVNAADVATLELLPGVGPSIAENIVIARRLSGGFEGPGDLLSVRFIGPKLLGRIESWVTYSGEVGRSDDAFSP